jgi:adenine-specific DNA-methyltransferase
MSKKKTKGEVFTKQFIIDFMLNETYDPTKMDYILEPGCGDSRFIIEILKRLILLYKDDIETLNDKISKIYGIEIDQINYNESVNNIEKLLSEYDFIEARPNIIHGDALINNIVEEIKFNYIVGNPPYVRIHNLPKEYLTILQKNYTFLKNGMVDIYYGFFELYKKCLSDDGVLCYITPNSYLYNNSSELVVETLYQDKMISKIYDFKSEKLFEDASTYTCITVLKKTEGTFAYNLTKKDFTIASHIDIEYGKETINFLSEVQNNIEGVKFSDLYKVKTGFATLADKVFVIANYQEDNGIITFTKNKKKYSIESTITKNCIKASKYDGTYNKVIFPYKNVNGRNVPMEETEFTENYPLAHAYLSDNMVKLMNRDKGKNEKYKWFTWGRSQGLNDTNGNKIVISTIFENNPFIHVNNDVLVYSGYYIISQDDDILFTNNHFLESLKKISKPMSKGWFSLQKKILDNVIIVKENNE